MTAKHRKGKSNHKHEEDHVKNEITESETRTGGNSSTLLLFACLVLAVGCATGSWFCYQQHQTLTHLTDTVSGLQMKVVKLQASQETMRHTSDQLHASGDVESRLSALEELYTLAQKQVDEALASAEQLKTSDLPSQVQSLHTEMKSRLTEIQQATVSVEQLSQLQARLQEQAEEFEGVRLQIEGLSISSADMSMQVQAMTGRLEEAEAILDDVATLRDDLEEQTAQLTRLELQLKSYLTEMAAIRKLIPNEPAEQFQQANVEEQISALRMSIREQNSASHDLQAELRAQLDNLQSQVTQLVGAEAAPEPAKQAEGEPIPLDEEVEVATGKEAKLVAAEPNSDEPVQEASNGVSYTEQKQQLLRSPEIAETDATHTAREETLSNEEEKFLEELLLDEGDAKPDEEDHDDNDESIVDAEQVESEEKEFGNEAEL